MVTRLTGERAQLLLIGAIAISLVILGTVVLLNGMKFTETVGSDGNEEAFTEAERRANMIESDLARLSSRIRNETSLTEFEDALESNVTSYSHAYANMSVNRGTVYVDVSLNTSCTSCQYRLMNQSGGPITNGSKNSTLGSEITRLPAFELNITSLHNVGVGTDSSFWIEVRNDTGSTWKMRINETNNPSAPARYITTYDDKGVIATYNSSESWFDDNATISLHVTAGRIDANGSGNFAHRDGLAFARGVERPYTVSFNNTAPGAGGGSGVGWKTNGSYRVIANGEGPADDRIGLDTPKFEIVYERPEVQYRKTLTLNRTEP